MSRVRMRSSRMSNDSSSSGGSMSTFKTRNYDAGVAYITVHSARKDGDVAKPIEAPRYDELDAAVYAVMRSRLRLRRRLRPRMTSTEPCDSLGVEFQPKSVLDFDPDRGRRTGEYVVVSSTWARTGRRRLEETVISTARSRTVGAGHDAFRVDAAARTRKHRGRARRAAEALERLSLQNAMSEEDGNGADAEENARMTLSVS